jgi:carbon monoxide dehydrogenase subunit G
MAYLRNEDEKLEVDYPIEKIWAAIPEVTKILEWKIEEKNDSTHKATLKTKGGFMAYSSLMYVEAAAVDENTTRITIKADTPVTTITSIIDFGRTRDRIGQFIELLAKLMENKKP